MSEIEPVVNDLVKMTEMCVEKDKEIERLNKKIEQYENPEDMTLMFMWCDEKAKDEIKRLNNIINELENYIRARADDNDTCSVCSVMTDDLLNILQGSESNE